MTPEDQLTPQYAQMTLPEFADAVGDKLGLPKVLRDSIFERESGFQHYDINGRVKRSSAGALGIGQLMPDTARRFGVNPNDPLDNIYGALKYQKFLYDKYLADTGDEKQAMLLTAAAYNSGEGNVEKYKGIPPFTETQNYVRYVASRIKGSQPVQAIKEAVDWQNPESVQAETNQVFASPEEQARQVTKTRTSTQTISPYDLEWHLGIPAAQAAGWFEGLPKRKQAEVYRTVANAVAQDQIKKAQGVELTPSATYQADMRRQLKIVAPVFSTANARRVMGVPPEPTPLALPQVGGGVPTMASIVSQARQQGGTRSPQQVNDDALMEQAVKNVSPSFLGDVVGGVFPSGAIRNLKYLYRAATKGQEGAFEAAVQEEFQKLKEQQARANTPEMIAARKRIGSIPGASPRGLGSPRGVLGEFQRFGGEALKALGGATEAQGLITSLGGLIPGIKGTTNQIRDYLNERGNVLAESVDMPLTAQGEAIEKELPEKLTSTATRLGLSLAQLILLKRATGLNLGPLLAIETTLKNSDRPVKERIPDALEAYVMGKVLDQHLSRPLSAVVFGAPTAIQTGEQYLKGNMSLEDALIQTVPQTIMGAVLGGKPKTPLEARTLTKVPEFPEEVQGVPPQLSEFVKRQNDFYQNRINTAEAIGDTERANQLRQQWASVQQRLGKMETRAVPTEPQTGLTPELEARVNRAFENERLRNQPAIMPSEPIAPPAQPDPRFAGVADEDLLSRIETLQQRPPKGTSKAKRAAMADELQAAQIEIRRRFAEPSATLPSAEDIPSFKDFVENHPRAGGVRLDSLDVNDPLFQQRAEEYVQLYGGQENAISQRIGKENNEAELRGVRQGQDVPAYGSEVRQEASGRTAGSRGAEAGGQVEESLVGRRIQSGSVTGTVIEETPNKVRVRSDRGSEVIVPKGPNIVVLRSVPTEPATSARPAERLQEPLLTPSGVPLEPTATVAPQTLQSGAAQPVSPITETTASFLSEKAKDFAATGVQRGQPADVVPVKATSNESEIRLLLRSGQGRQLDARLIYKPVGSSEAVVEIRGQRFTVDNAKRLSEAGVKIAGTERQGQVRGKSQREVTEFLRQYPRLTAEDFSVSKPADVVREPQLTPTELLPRAETYYRGLNAEREQTGDQYYSDAKDVAEEYQAQRGAKGAIREVKGVDLPQNLFETTNKQELADQLGIDKPYGPDFDTKARAVLQRKGYAGIRYSDGTFGADEIHVFGSQRSDPKPNDIVNGNKVVDAWRTATAKTADGQLHITLEDAKGRRFTLTGREADQAVAKSAPSPQVTSPTKAAGETPRPQPASNKPEQVVSHSKPELDGAKVIGKREGGKKLAVEKKDGTRTVIQNPKGELGNQQAAIRTSVPVEPLKPIPILSGGKESTATTERGTEVNTRYAVVEAKDLVTSHDNFQNENERFPSELQPRDRSRVASAAQIADIVKNPRPAELADSPKVAHGSPIISDDGVVEVGNGRSIAIRQIYENGGENADRYRQFLLDNADRLGLDKSAIDKAKEPVLVRVRTTPLDDAQRIQFVNEGNEQGGARMSAPEQAIADARQISGPLLSIFRPSESGEINTAANHGFITAFMRDVVGPAIGEYVDARGAISQAGIARIRNAIFAHAYADSPQGVIALEKLAESPDSNVRNITNALLQRAGGFSNLKEGIADGTRYDTLDITGDLTKALSKMSSLREQGQTVGDYLKQNELFDPELSPLQRQMLHILDEYKRSGKAISEVLGNYLALTEAAGNPNQEGLFGTRETPPDPEDLFESAVRKAQEDVNATKGQRTQTDLFTSQGVPPEPATGRSGAGISTPAIEGAGQSSDQSGAGLFEANQPTQGAGGAGSGPLGFGRGRGVTTPPPLPQTESELRDVQKQMTPGLGSKHGEIVDGLLSASLPSAISPEHLGEAELLGMRIGEMNRRVESSEVARKPWISKFYKAGVDRADIKLEDNPGVQFMSAVSTGRPVDPKFEGYAKLRRILYDGRLRLLEQAGVQLQQMREDYFPGIWLRESRIAFNAALQDAISEGIIPQDANLNRTTPEQRAWVKARTDAYYEQGTGSDRDMLSYISRRPLAGKESFLKEKVFDEDILTAMELGLRPASYNPAELDGLKLTEMDRSIMAHQHYGDLNAKGQQQIITPYEQVPAGWVKSKDKYGTIYGPPTVELTEHIDKAVYQGLLDVANKLGISHERVASLGRGKLGLSYQGENRIQTKFATETSVMAHEIGHQLDQKYDLWNNLLRTQPKSGEPGKGFRPGRSELRNIADLTERGKVSRSKEEKIAQVLEAYIHAPERMQEVAPRVFKWFDNFVKTTPELAPLAGIKPGIALQKLTTEKYVGLPIIGYRIVPEPVGDILNNYLSSSLYNSRALGKPYKEWMWFASLLNQAQLGMGSAFHASFTSFDVQMRAQSNVIKDIYGMLRGNRTLSNVAGSMGKAAIAIGRTPTVGDQVLNAWRYPDRPVDPKIAQVTRALELAQAGFKIERGLRLEDSEKVARDWYSDRKIQAALRSPFAAVELMSKPIMEWIVPREKAGAFADMAWRIIERNPGKSLEELTPDFRKAWNRIDGTLGQVRYDRVFMNNMLKNFFQGIIRAPGWTGGTLVELGGAFKDVGSFTREWVKTGKPPQEMPDRVAYGISLLLTSAIVNGALTWAFTGQRPHGMDFFAFRDGNKDKDGNETRMLIPSYMKDILAYYEDGIPKTLVAKGHPAIALANDVLWRNQDYFGQEIRNPDDPYLPHELSAKGVKGSQAYEAGKYVLKAFVPFWMRGVQRQEEQGAGLGKQGAAYFGVMPAPGYLIQDESTKALNQMIKDKLPSVRTPPTDRQQAMKEIIQGRRSGEDTATDLLAARQEGLINKRDVQRIGEQGRISPMQAKMETVYRDYGIDGVLSWFEKYQDVMVSEDKADAQKVLRKARLSMMRNPESIRGTAEERHALIQRLNKALGLSSVPMAPPTQGQNMSISP